MPFQGKKQDQKRWNGSAYAPPHVMEDEDRAAGSVEYTSAPPPSSVTTPGPDNTKAASEGGGQSTSDKANAGSGLGNWASGSGDPDTQETPPVSLYDKYMRDIANINTPYDWYSVNEQLTADAYRGEQDAPYETLIDILNMRMDEYGNIIPIANIQRAPSPAELAEIGRTFEEENAPMIQYSKAIHDAQTTEEIDRILGELEAENPLLGSSPEWDTLSSASVSIPDHWANGMYASAQAKKAQIMEGNRGLYPSPYEMLDQQTWATQEALVADRDAAMEALYEEYKKHAPPGTEEDVIRHIFDETFLPIVMSENYGALDSMDQVMGSEFDTFLGQARGLMEDYYSGAELNRVLNDVRTQDLDLSQKAARLGFEETPAEQVMDELWQWRQSGGSYSPSFMSQPDAVGNGPGANQSTEEVAAVLVKDIAAQSQQKLDELMAAEPTASTSEHDEWEYQVAVAKYELAQAEKQVIMSQRGFGEKAEEGSQITGNSVEQASWVADILRQYGVDELTIYGIRMNGLGMDYNDTEGKPMFSNYIDELKEYGVPDDIINKIPHSSNEYSPFALADVMRPSEKATYNYLLLPENGGQQAADAYFELLRESLYYRNGQEWDVLREKVDSTAGTLESIPGMPFAAGKAMLGTLANWIQGKETSSFNPDYALLQDYEYYREDVREMLPPAVQPLFDAGLSLSDMAMAYTLTGGAAGMNLIMANNAGAGIVLGTLENGGTINEAVGKAIPAMAIQLASQELKIGEYATNKFIGPDQFKGLTDKFFRGGFGSVVEDMPASIYLKATERYDALWAERYNIELAELKKKRMPSNETELEEIKQLAAINAQKQATTEAFSSGMQDLFSTFISGGMSADAEYAYSQVKGR